MFSVHTQSTQHSLITVALLEELDSDEEEKLELDGDELLLLGELDDELMLELELDDGEEEDDERLELDELLDELLQFPTQAVIPEFFGQASGSAQVSSIQSVFAYTPSALHVGGPVPPVKVILQALPNVNGSPLPLTIKPSVYSRPPEHVHTRKIHGAVGKLAGGMP